jgi:hypothetical protein
MQMLSARFGAWHHDQSTLGVHKHFAVSGAVTPSAQACQPCFLHVSLTALSACPSCLQKQYVSSFHHEGTPSGLLW